MFLVLALKALEWVEWEDLEETALKTILEDHSEGLALREQKKSLEKSLEKSLLVLVLEEEVRKQGKPNFSAVLMRYSKSNPSKNNRRDVFDNDDDDMFGDFGMGNMLKNFGFGAFGGLGGMRGFGRDPFQDDFFRGFGSGFGGMEQMMANMGSMNGMGGGFKGASKSVSTSTIIR